MSPDASRHDPNPDYLRHLLQRVGATQTEAARRLGVSGRMMRMYLADPGGCARHVPAPYLVQYALEGLACASLNAEPTRHTTERFAGRESLQQRPE